VKKTCSKGDCVKLGLSIVISGAIIMIAMLSVLFNLPVLMDSIKSVEETSSKILKLENKISQTDIELTSISASPGSDMVNLELFNNGNEKLWNWDKFDLFITYDADTGGASPTRITEKITYNDVGLGLTADFNIQRGIVAFGAAEDAETITLATPVRSFGNGGYAFVRITDVQHVSSGFDGGTDGNDENGIMAKLTAKDTITFTRQPTAINQDQRVVWEVWEYIGPPGGSNELIVRLDIQVTTISATPVDTLILNVVNREKLVPFFSGLLNSQTDADWHDVQHTMNVFDGGSGTTYLRVDRDGIDALPSNVGVTVLEFTGSNWIIQNNILHDFTAAGATQTETVAGNGDFLAPVNAWSEAFIYSTYHMKEDGSDDDRDEVGHNVWPGATTDSINFRIRAGADAPITGYTAIAHIVENPDMSVNHLDSITGGETDLTGGGGDPDIEPKVFAPAVGSTAETGLIATTDTAGGGNPIPRAFWEYRLTLANTVEFRRSADGGAGDWALQVIEFPQLDSPLSATLWSVFNIKNDYTDPGILNNQETAQITAQLSNPIFQDGLVVVQLASENGIQASISQVVT